MAKDSKDSKDLKDPELDSNFIGLIVKSEEYTEISKIADYYGTSVAQVTRGFLRLGMTKLGKEGPLTAVQLGKSGGSGDK